MRITESLKYATVTSQLSQLREQYYQNTQQATTGKRVNAPSDDPIAAAENVRIQTSLSQGSDYKKTITIVQTNAQLAESSLDSAGQLMQHAIELAMSGSNQTQSAEAFQALAADANHVIEQMVAIGNTKGASGYIFGGTLTDAAPFDPSGSYLGNDESQQVNVGDGPPMNVTVSGTKAFANPSGRDVIQDLKDLATALSSGSSDNVRALLGSLQTSHGQIVQERAHAGFILDRLSLASTLLSQNNLTLNSESSALTDADTAATLSTLTQLGTTIQQAVAADQRLLQMTTVTLPG